MADLYADLYLDANLYPHEHLYPDRGHQHLYQPGAEHYYKWVGGLLEF